MYKFQTLNKAFEEIKDFDNSKKIAVLLSELIELIENILPNHPEQGYLIDLIKSIKKFLKEENSIRDEDEDEHTKGDVNLSEFLADIEILQDVDTYEKTQSYTLKNNKP